MMECVCVSTCFHFEDPCHIQALIIGRRSRSTLSSSHSFARAARTPKGPVDPVVPLALQQRSAYARSFEVLQHGVQCTRRNSARVYLSTAQTPSTLHLEATSAVTLHAVKSITSIADNKCCRTYCKIVTVTPWQHSLAARNRSTTAQTPVHPIALSVLPAKTSRGAQLISLHYTLAYDTAFTPTAFGASLAPAKASVTHSVGT